MTQVSTKTEWDAAIKNGRLKDITLDDLALKDITDDMPNITHYGVFRNVDFTGLRLANRTFEKCIFVECVFGNTGTERADRTLFYNSQFENCTFKGRTNASFTRCVIAATTFETTHDSLITISNSAIENVDVRGDADIWLDTTTAAMLRLAGTRASVHAVDSRLDRMRVIEPMDVDLGLTRTMVDEGDFSKAEPFGLELNNSILRDAGLPDGWEVLTMGPIGSRRDLVTVVLEPGDEADALAFHAGCFQGETADLEARIAVEPLPENGWNEYTPNRESRRLQLKQYKTFIKASKRLVKLRAARARGKD